MSTLNIDLTQADIENKLSTLQKAITTKLTEGYGYELQDDTLATWIVMVAVRNNGVKEEVKNDLVEFIQENAQDFTEWLWQEAPKICSPPKKEVKEVEKPKTKVIVSNTNRDFGELGANSISSFNKSQPQTSDKNKKQPQSHNSANLMKKAIDDTKKPPKEENKKNDKGKEASSYVKTDKDGRKVISLNKGSHRVEEEDISDNRPKYNKDEKKPQGKSSGSNVLDRIHRKGPDADKGGYIFTLTQN